METLGSTVSDERSEESSRSLFPSTLRTCFQGQTGNQEIGFAVDLDQKSSAAHDGGSAPSKV